MTESVKERLAAFLGSLDVPSSRSGTAVVQQRADQAAVPPPEKVCSIRRAPPPADGGCATFFRSSVTYVSTAGTLHVVSRDSLYPDVQRSTDHCEA